MFHTYVCSNDKWLAGLPVDYVHTSTHCTLTMLMLSHPVLCGMHTFAGI